MIPRVTCDQDDQDSEQDLDDPFDRCVGSVLDKEAALLREQVQAVELTSGPLGVGGECQSRIGPIGALCRSLSAW